MEIINITEDQKEKLCDILARLTHKFQQDQFVECIYFTTYDRFEDSLYALELTLVIRNLNLKKKKLLEQYTKLLSKESSLRKYGIRIYVHGSYAEKYTLFDLNPSEVRASNDLFNSTILFDRTGEYTEIKDKQSKVKGINNLYFDYENLAEIVPPLDLSLIEKKIKSRYKKPMFKYGKLRHSEFRMEKGNITKEIGDDVFGYCKVDGFCGDLYAPIKEANIVKEIDNEECYFAEVNTSVCDTDHHNYSEEIKFHGVFLAFDLDTQKSFDEDYLTYIKEILEKHNMVNAIYGYELSIEKYGYLKIVLPNMELDENVLNCAKDILNKINDYHQEKVKRMNSCFAPYLSRK